MSRLQISCCRGRLALVAVVVGSLCVFSGRSTEAAVMSGILPNANHPTLQLWLEGSSLPGSTTSVTTWADSSSKNNAVSHGVAGEQPTYVVANPAFNNWPTVHFDGNDRLNSALSTTAMGIDGANDKTVFVVFKQDTTANRNVLGFGTSTTGAMFDVLLHSNKIVGHFNGSTFDTIGVTTQTYTAGLRTIAALTYDGTFVDVFQHDATFNGQIGSKALALNTGNGLVRLGGIFSSYNFFNGDIAEVLIYNEELSESDRLAVDEYLFSKYNMTPAAWNQQFIVPEPTSAVLMLPALLFARRARARAKLARK